MSGVVLLTGATGFLGTQVARALLRDTPHRVVALVRAEDREAAGRRLARAWWDWPDLAGAIGGRVEVLQGDITLPKLGLGDATYDHLVARLTHIIHTAADLRLHAPIAELRRSNVEGTAHVLELARASHRHHGLARFAHVSTAYVAGGRRGRVPENSLTDRFGFSSAYERSKYEGERLVQAAREELPISVFRPGMVVGDSRSGAIKTFNTFYLPLRLYLNGRLPLIPARRDLPLNLVPVDYVAEAVVRLTFHPGAAGLTFHLTAPRESLPRAGELLDFVRAWARDHLGLRLGRPLFLPLPLPPAWERWARRAPLAAEGHALAGLLALLPYCHDRQEFLRENVDRLLDPWTLDWRDLLPHLLAYAVARGFLHRSERTVHEQILARLANPHRTVAYHDLEEGRSVHRPAAVVRREMLAAAGALRALDIRPGDRVALVGPNSTRYLTLDVAIGLVGAVSVPLYPTSPPAEIDAILAASGARLLLVGTPALLERAGALAASIPVVSFCPGPLPAGAPRPAMEWSEFLALGAASPGPASAPVGFGDPATLRYTSGTTGPPKGVVFHHGHLRWMAETMASLLPWPARTRPATYLSFLPMHHVVEGILATYSPYYLPAPVTIAFLEEFRDLPRALPRVRPTIFFSVPRFYEKLWERLQQHPVGRLYARCPEGPARQLLAALLRRAALRRAGLDRCVQLIVGSAPSSEALLRAFHELGIEVHNAYGLTEAPLVTLNRVSANRVGTVGVPLPDTEVRVAEDGEVLVRGPQVAAGYFGEAAQPFRDGWLPTGDLGYLTAGGSLVVQGRKKDLIATAYGKKVHAGKVEAMLRGIPGVVEALLVGEARPYCAALIWLSHPPASEAVAQAIDRAVAAMNRRLSHPEQVKRWALLANDLSTQGGDLTATLKLRRAAVLRRHAAAIAALYDEGPLPATVLHRCGAERDATVAL